MKMNTMCIRRSDNKVDHNMVEVGPRHAIHKSMDLSLDPGGISKAVSIPYSSLYECSKCGDRGVFDQDGNAIEYHQPTTVMTGG